MARQLISFVIPAYNESELLPSTVKSIIENIPESYDYEIVIVNDWSKDHTWKVIQKLGEENKKIRWVNFSRNFWKEIALSAWLDYADWDAVITIDADGQHPVEKIPLFLKTWKQGYDIVYNRRPEIAGATRLKKITSSWFYKIFNSISDFKLEPSTTDYRLLDKRVVQVFRKFKERNRIFRWLVDLIGFRKKVLIFDALPNPEGRAPSYNYLKLSKLALNSITSFSLFPLKLVWIVWTLITLASFIGFFVMLIDRLNHGPIWSTPLAFVVILNTFLMGIVLMSLWMIALYIANIHDEVQWRPLYFVSETIN